MQNKFAEENINNCLQEFERIHHLIEGVGQLSPMVPFLTRYAIIKSCGTIELCFKTIVSDFHSNQSAQIRNFIDNTIRNSSMNPSKDNICKTLKKFDEKWNEDFKNELSKIENSKRIQDSLDSLNNARNDFAHGGNPTPSFDNIRDYFNDVIEVIKIIDRVVV